MASRNKKNRLRAAAENMSKESTKDKPLFRVRPLKQARSESRVRGGLFQTADELLWVTSQLKLLRHWPLDRATQENISADLDFSKADQDKERFIEWRPTAVRLPQQ